MTFDLGGFAGLVVAILGGAAVGVERQRSGHATGPDARLGGIRTFTLLGTLAGIAGLLIESGQPIPASLLLAGGIAVIVAGYIRASSKDIDATTEVAAIVVLGAGALGGLGFLRLSAALTTLTVLLLAEKPRLHGFVDAARRADDAGGGAVRGDVDRDPAAAAGRTVWPGPRHQAARAVDARAAVLGHELRRLHRAAHERRGRISADRTPRRPGVVDERHADLRAIEQGHPQQQGPLAVGAVAASTVLFFRVAVAVAVLNAALLPVLARFLAAPLIVAIIAVALALAIAARIGGRREALKNPLQLLSAIEMALLFQVVLFAVYYMRQWVGDAGLLVSGFVLGLTDVDALTLSMTRSVSTGTTIESACRAIAMGIVANSIMKTVIAVAIGNRAIRVADRPVARRHGGRGRGRRHVAVVTCALRRRSSCRPS